MAVMTQNPVDVVIRTEFGDIQLELFDNLAPLSSAYFRKIVREGSLNGTSFFRIVAEGNQPAEITERIEVIQGGRKIPTDAQFDHVSHETTTESGLKHQAYTISLARFSPGQVYKSFFITVRDEPALDHGGMRNADGEGFAAFGRVVAGIEVVDRIFACQESSDMLKNEIRIISVAEV